MIDKIVNVGLGIIFYILGILSVTYFFPNSINSFLTGTFGLIVLTLGIFFISSSFSGKFSFVLLFFAGTLMGQYAETKFLYTAFSTIPMLIAMIGGSRIGKDANADMQGKTNLFEGTWDYFAYLLIAIVLAIAIGFFADSFPVISLGL